MTEQDKFEQWYLDNWKKNCAWAANYDISEIQKLRGDDGNYPDRGYLQGCWDGWLAAKGITE